MPCGIDMEKVKVIQNWQSPTKVQILQPFFDLTDHYQYFIDGYSLIATPIIDLLKKNMMWHEQNQYMMPLIYWRGH